MFFFSFQPYKHSQTLTQVYNPTFPSLPWLPFSITLNLKPLLLFNTTITIYNITQKSQLPCLTISTIALPNLNLRQHHSKRPFLWFFSKKIFYSFPAIYLVESHIYSIFFPFLSFIIKKHTLKPSNSV